MERRRFLQRGAVGVALGTVGCLGSGGEVVVTVSREVSVQPGTGWIREIPDVSDPGGSISYISRSQVPFDVYFFTNKKQMQRYDAYTNGEDPEKRPTGNRDIGRTATETTGGEYKASTKNDGGRQTIDEAGPYYFVLDHSDYPAAGGAWPSDMPKRRTIYLDLTVTRQRFGL
ncbi:twin-arginine translocation signal domain-containing protein [Halorientalis pallida]|uniref:Twin-arginine translocation signal domain-containing protein n=1 Tax=Halorientalis pallida TaxID=2479928 RepID=A0A498KXT0_9EURY|nr:twin-arginine translocation signal domain-containing protein [Halorientalis pallida]RXK50432.1 twin-arginine translocation signal domain-containing protein [Halorientalis pallida]